MSCKSLNVKCETEDQKNSIVNTINNIKLNFFACDRKKYAEIIESALLYYESHLDDKKHNFRRDRTK
jgi:hypothetical protein